VGAHVAVNRVWPTAASEASPEPFLPGQRIDLESILAAYTSGSARINGLATSAGAVMTGMDADVAVVDADLSRVPAGDIGSAAVAQTWVGGQLVCQRS
jgi:predicted amidohydrolase YtcJ